MGKNIKENLRELIKARSINGKKLERLSGVSYGYIRALLDGTRVNPGAEVLLKLSHALSISIEELLGQKDITPSQGGGTAIPTGKQYVKEGFHKFVVPHLGVGDEAVEEAFISVGVAAHPGIEGYVVRGNCLEPVLRDGDIILIDKDMEAALGDLIVCIIKSTFHVGRLLEVNDERCLANNTRIIKLCDCTMVAPVIEIVKKLK